MSQQANLTVYLSPVEEVQHFFAHQPPYLGLIVAYALICLFLFWITRGKGYLISFFTAGLYLVPLWMH
jgi:hypothetical protein